MPTLYKQNDEIPSDAAHPSACIEKVILDKVFAQSCFDCLLTIYHVESQVFCLFPKQVKISDVKGSFPTMALIWVLSFHMKAAKFINSKENVVVLFDKSC